MDIPDDMNDADAARRLNAGAVVSIRDMLVLLGASDEMLRDCDERQEILAREPWRRDTLKFKAFSESNGGLIKFGTFEGEIDWSGTRFEEKK